MLFYSILRCFWGMVIVRCTVLKQPRKANRDFPVFKHQNDRRMYIKRKTEAVILKNTIFYYIFATDLLTNFIQVQRP